MCKHSSAVAYIYSLLTYSFTVFLFPEQCICISSATFNHGRMEMYPTEERSANKSIHILVPSTSSALPSASSSGNHGERQFAVAVHSGVKVCVCAKSSLYVTLKMTLPSFFHFRVLHKQPPFAPYNQKNPLSTNKQSTHI